MLSCFYPLVAVGKLIKTSRDGAASISTDDTDSVLSTDANHLIFCTFDMIKAGFIFIIGVAVSLFSDINTGESGSTLPPTANETLAGRFYSISASFVRAEGIAIKETMICVIIHE